MSRSRINSAAFRARGGAQKDDARRQQDPEKHAQRQAQRRRRYAADGERVRRMNQDNYRKHAEQRCEAKRRFHQKLWDGTIVKKPAASGKPAPHSL